MEGSYSVSMENITHEIVEKKAIEYLSKRSNIDEIRKIITNELKNNRISEFHESVEGWDSICFIMFTHPLSKKHKTTKTITYNESSDPHYWENQYNDIQSKIVIAGNRKSRVK